MINVSDTIQNLIDNNAPQYESVIMTLTDGTVFTLADEILSSSNNIIDEAGSSSFPIGIVLGKGFNFSINNIDDKFTDYDLYHATLKLKIVFSGTDEYINKGKYTITDAQQTDGIIDITSVDDIYKTDKTYTSNVSLPATIATLLQDACDTCGITLGFDPSTLNFADEEISSIPSSTTFRTFISYIAMMEGCNARLDINDNLQFIKWDFSKLDTEGSYWDLKDFMTVPTISKEEIEITAIRMSNNSSKLMEGTSTYVIDLTNLILDDTQLSTVTLYLYEMYNGKKFHIMDGELYKNPLIEFGDMAYSYNRKKNSFITPITDVTYTLHGTTQVKTQADNPTRSDSTYTSSASITSAAIQSVSEQLETEVSTREQVTQELQEALDAKSGMYESEEYDSEGNVIAHYIHDQPTRENSTFLIKITTQAIGFSTDGGETYPYGVTINGDVVANLLQANGVNADWITAGALTILDTDGNIIAKFDADNKTAQIAGWNIENGKIVSYDATAEFNSEVDALMFYNSSGTLVMKINNNGVYNYDNNGTLRSILALNYLQFYTSDAIKRIQFDSDGIDFYDLDGEIFGTLGFSTLYKVDSEGNITNEVNGYILGEKVYNDTQAMGWGIMAYKEDAGQYQRRIYYCNKDESDYVKDNFYVNCETQGLRHTEVDPYHAKAITRTSTGFKLTFGIADSSYDVTNTFTIARDSDGTITSITNEDTGETLTIGGSWS